MRFIEHGPDIPDELLLALDEERVVFFCGAGVSRAKAGLPGFLKLAENVLKDIRISKEDPIYKILQLAKSIEEPDGLSKLILLTEESLNKDKISDEDSIYKILELVKNIENHDSVSRLVSVDQIFSELRKRFESKIIEASVAKALRTKKNVNLKAHKILLDLATTKTGHTKLVTTNFDRLFENCFDENTISPTVWKYSRFPDFTREDTFEGLVYLHGQVNEDYSGSDNGFILSSAEFGKAYLAEASATQFFKDVIARYTIVFVGYAADDPPVRYLLEALNQKSGKPRNMYAFQSGNHHKAIEKWDYIAVTAIPYTNRKILWETLDAWAERAKNIEAWQNRIIKMAQRGPEKLSPFKREQVMHLVSTPKGAQRFCASDNPPPATWLCVFDSAVRFKTPTTITQKDGTETPVDYFNMYGLVSDPAPKPVDYMATREVPSKAWDAFLPNAQDMRDARDYSLAPMKGAQALSVKNLPNRLYALGTWIAKVSDQNAAVWWAVQQQGIYQQIQERIRLFLQDKTDIAPDIAKSWHYLFDSWNLKPSEMENHRHDWFLFEKDIKKFGWNIPMVRRYEEMAKPRMTVRLNFWGNEIPPKKNAKLESGQLVDLNILYKNDYRRIDIPDKCLANVVAALRRNLDIAIRLEMERGYYPHIAIPPIITSDDPDISGHSRTYGFSGPALYYASLFERLLKLNPTLAQAEIEKWDKDDDNFYARLRIWSCGFSEIVGDDSIGGVFT